MPYSRFDPGRLELRPLAEREHDLDRSVLVFPADVRTEFEHPAIPLLADRIAAAHRQKKIVIAFCGAHVVRRGLGPLLIDWMARGVLNHLALNGAAAIHDFELALIGATTESVARYLQEGQFGLWRETGRLNVAAVTAAREDLGFGEALGRMIVEEEFPFAATSVLAAGYRLGVPVTVHVSFGQDIVHEHPNFDPEATGRATYTDFLVFTASVERLQGGVFLNLGSAVAGPEVFLKALAMARNVARREGRRLDRFTTAVFDLVELGRDWSREPAKNDPRYYFRPCKTLLVRSVAGGGSSYYIQGDHRETIPALFTAVRCRLGDTGGGAEEGEGDGPQ